MKKRLVAVFIVITIILALVAGCGRIRNSIGNSIENAIGNAVGNIPDDKPDDSTPKDNKPAGGKGGNNNSSGSGGNSAAPTNPSESYQAYLDTKSKAVDRISDKIGEFDELAFSVGMALFPLLFVDMAFIPITMIGMDKAAANFLGFEVKQNGSVYTITYEENGEKMTQTCDYDVKTDSMRCTITTGDKETIYFEYARVGSGYASQYTTREGDGYSLNRVFCDDNSIGIGMQTVTSPPQSIFKDNKVKLGFVENDASYFILEGDTLIIFKDGEKKVY